MTKHNDKELKVSFWGTRGTLPVSGAPFSRTGGNTNCVEVTCGEHTIIIDAGTGIRELGSRLVSQNPNQKIHLLLTHAHYDHVEGIPFFAPFFIESSNIEVYCGKLDGIKNTKDLFTNLMKRPFFPVGPEVFSANVTFNTLEDKSSFLIGDDIKVQTTPLNHPGGSTGYRIDFAGKSYACITDTEHIPGTHDENILTLIDNVDTFSYDCSLLDQELPDFEGYGHSTFEEGVRLANEVNSECFYASHHMPFRNDSELEQIEAKLNETSNKCKIAHEGLTIKL